jgi:hypothetical protein
MTLTYLACPYSHPDPAVREHRFKMANVYAAKLFNAGEVVFSPISMSHPMAEDGGLRGDWDTWEQFDRAYLSLSKKVVVLTLDGWERSKGVAAEMEIARQLGIPVEFLDA